VPHETIPFPAYRALITAGEALRSSTAKALRRLPEQERTAKVLAARFGVDGVVARRLIRLANAESPLIALTRVPNDRHVEAFAAALGDDGIAQRLRGALSMYREALRTARMDPVELKRAIRDDDVSLRSAAPTIAEVPLLADGFGLPAEAPSGAVIAWTGIPGADDQWARDPAAFGPAAQEQLLAALDRLAPTLTERGWRLLLRPHARHVVSDGPGALACLAAIDERGWPIGLALDPESMLEDDMRPAALDHLTRVFESVGPRAEVVITGPDHADAAAGLIDRHCPAGMVVIPAAALVAPPGAVR